MSDTTLTHKDLGRMLGVSETTIKSYRRKFPDCIPVANDGKPIRFTKEAGKVCLRIRELFSRGMSVPEVRARLEKEYAWIEPLPESLQEEPAEIVQPVAPAIPSGPVEVELPEDYTQALSNLAKSMVNLTMKQDAIARRMEAIDARLQKMEVHTGDKAPFMEAWMERAEALLARLESLAGVAEKPDAHVSPAASEAEASKRAEVELAQGKVVRIRNAYGDVNEYTVETSDCSAKNTADLSTESAHAETDATTDATAEDTDFIFDADEQLAEAPAIQEPPRVLLTMPLVIQSPEGEFLGVAGRTRGRFNINDLKAMLMSHFEGHERFTLQWQHTDNGWLMLLEQKELSDPYSLALLVDQTTTPKGNNVALIEHLTINGNDENPVEMYNFINRIYES